MRIDLYSSAATANEATQQTNKISTETSIASANKQSAAQAASTEDTTSLTANSDAVNALAKTALEPIPSRQAKVASLQFAVSSAQYQLDSAKVADALSSADV